MNGEMVKNHISLKTGFGYNATRRTSFRSWFQACQRVRPPVLITQLQGHLQDRRVIVLHLLQPTATSSDNETREREDRIESGISPVPVSEFVDDRTEQPVVDQANEIQKPNKKETTIERGNPCVILRSRNGCKNAGKFWWMMKCHYREALTPVLLMKFL